jgi:hypothetical protein
MNCLIRHTLSFPGPYNFLSTLLEDIRDASPSLKVRDHISYPYKPTEDLFRL